jgi:predicted NAD-dependent protein-ADP-ribosyltransferase YbiA (DUF1768 family)
MSYGIFNCSSERRTFHSPDQYIAFKMLARPEDRASIMKTPNGYLAHNNLQAILSESKSYLDNEVIVKNWEADRDAIMHYCLQQKFSQSAMLAESLMRTRERPIIDDSRGDETYWCDAQGKGLDKHGKLLEKVRAELISGELLPYVSRAR